MAVFLKTAELILSAAWFPWQSFLYIIFISPQFSWREKNTKRGKKPKHPSELSKTPKLCFSFTSLLENSREQKCCFRRSHCSVGSSNFFPWHEEEWRGLKWELTSKDINSYPRFWVPTHYTAGSASTPSQSLLCSTKKKVSHKNPCSQRWKVTVLLSGITAQEFTWSTMKEEIWSISASTTQPLTHSGERCFCLLFLQMLWQLPCSPQ